MAIFLETWRLANVYDCMWQTLFLIFGSRNYLISFDRQQIRHATRIHKLAQCTSIIKLNKNGFLWLLQLSHLDTLPNVQMASLHKPQWLMVVQVYSTS